MISGIKQTLTRPVLRRLLTPLACILFLLVLGSSMALLINQKQNTNRSSQYLLKEVVRSLDISLQQKAQMIAALGDGLLQNPELHKALQARDRKQLLALFTTTFADFHTNYTITHFYFHQPDKINLLRIHKPDKYGDRINRFTLNKAEETGMTAWGIELGVLGTFTLRIVQPVYLDKNLIGYLELGKEIEDVLGFVHQQFAVELAVLINKDLLEQETWDTGMEMLGRTSDWQRYQDMALIYYTQSHFPSDLDRFIHGEKVHKHDDIEGEAQSDHTAWQLIIHPLNDASGRVVGDLVILRDITAVKTGFIKIVSATVLCALLLVGGVLIFYYVILRQTDREIDQHHKNLRESEAKFRNLVESSNDWIWEMDTAGIYTYASPQVENILGYTPAEIIGKTPFDLMGPEEINQTTRVFNTLAETAQPILHLEHIALHKDKHPIVLETNGVPSFDNEGQITGYIGINRDITKRKQAETTRIRLATAIEQASETVVITDLQGSIQYTNPAFEKLTGYTCEEALGQNPRILNSGTQDPAFYKKMWDQLLRGEIWHGRMINKKKDGSLFEEEVTISPVKDNAGKISNFVAVKRDVSKEAALEKQLQQSMKMEAIGTMAGGIAHDFNNILSAILGYSELIQQEVPQESSAGRDIAQVITSAKRAASLVKQILTFSRQTGSEKMFIHPHLIVHEALNMLRATLPATIHITERLDADCGTILAAPTIIHQIVINLCTNSMHAMPDQKGILTVELQGLELTAADTSRGDKVFPGDYIVLTVKDDGCGMDQPTVDRIFDPYFTTKELGRGTGLGLAVVHGAVEEYRGFIEVKSRVGEGSIFSVYFPKRTEPESNAATEQQDRVEPLPGQERILVVDDEPLLVKINKKRLAGRGYQVSTFTDSTLALEAFRRSPDSFDLLITDQTMPGLTGIELAEAVLEIKPSLAIIMCTGHSDTVSAEKAHAVGIARFVIKPLTTSELLDAVEDVLAEKKMTDHGADKGRY